MVYRIWRIDALLHDGALMAMHGGVPAHAVPVMIAGSNGRTRRQYTLIRCGAPNPHDDKAPGTGGAAIQHRGAAVAT
jgi:hypothetical protein